MKMLDTNMIIRFLLKDNQEMSDTVREIIENNTVIITVEVIAEVIYVLAKVYKVERKVIKEVIDNLCITENVEIRELKVIEKSIELYEKNKLDFVDCLLCAYHIEYGYEICTFDKKLNKLIEKSDNK